MSGRRQSKADEKKSCCTWPRIIVLVILIAVSGVLIWKFAPVNDAIDSILPSYNSSTSSSSSGNGTTGGGSAPTASPTEDQGYQFNQCQDPTSSDCCNGLDSICDLRVDEILYATLHNGMATFEDGFIFGPNHKFKLEGALEAGYRGLNLDICNCGGEHIFCHGICSLGPREVDDVMMGVNQFLDDNPTEVVVFIYQVNSDVDQEVNLQQFYNKMSLVDGFVDKIYVHGGPNSTWPTLGELTDPNVNKVRTIPVIWTPTDCLGCVVVVAAFSLSSLLFQRVIMFHYNGPDCTTDGACPDGLHNYYDYASDTDWEHSSVESIQDTANSCLFRPNGGANTNTFVGVNNFISPPSEDAARILNSYSEAMNLVDTCSSILGTDVNFILADFWSDGELPRVTQEHNTARALQQRRKRRLLRADGA